MRQLSCIKPLSGAVVRGHLSGFLHCRICLLIGPVHLGLVLLRGGNEYHRLALFPPTSFEPGTGQRSLRKHVVRSPMLYFAAELEDGELRWLTGHPGRHDE